MQSLEQWYAKLKSFVPGWWSAEDSKYALSVFSAIAAILAGYDEDSEDQFSSTFLLQASAPIIDAHGAERGNPRLPGESTEAYAERIQRITSQTFRSAIKAFIDSLLLVGECTIYEAPLDSPYFSRGVYLSRGSLLIGIRTNYFIVSVPKQIHDPYSFYTREGYLGRGDFIGAGDVTSTRFESIIKGINDMKAFGVMYSIVER